VTYAGFAKDRAQLKAVLDDYQKVHAREFDAWTKPQQQAFLINAYNAFTVEKILTRYPNLKSIRDFGTRLRQSVEGQVLHALRPARRISTSSSTRPAQGRRL
jgi:hypothetical protein